MNLPGAADRPRRYGVVARLLLGFIGGIVLVGLLLALGDRALESATRRMQQTLGEHVRPLVRLQQLQSRLGALRQREIELSRIRDFYPVLSHIDRMRADIAAIDADFTQFGLPAGATDTDRERFADHWKIYRGLLERQLEFAARMEMGAAEKISTNESFSPFSSIERTLGDTARQTDTAAEAAYRQLVAEQDEHRRTFKVIVLGGSILLMGGLVVFGSSLARRISALRDSALRVAAGEGAEGVVISGSDEITDLGAAFNTMQDRVAARESALRAAREELELRVERRTRALREANGRLILFSQAVEQSPVGILIASRDGRIQYVNEAYTVITGHQAATLVGAHISALSDETDNSGLAGAIDDAMATGREWETERRSRRPDGTEYWEHLRVVPVLDEDGAIGHLLLSREDFTARKTQDEKIAYQAHYDALTGLPNRALALDRLVQATGRARRDGGKSVAMFIDLDNFKQINDTLGHAAGDALLRQAASRLKDAVRNEDTVARLGGDEFLVIMSGLSHTGAAQAVAEKIIRAFSAPFMIEGRGLGASPSIGLAVYPDDGDEPAVLLRNADLAMYEAKEAGRNTYRFFNQSIHDLSLQRLELGRCLRSALERGELRVVYQPLIAALDGRVIGAEALLRWDSPELGSVAPESFIPIAEQNGLIVDIGAWAMREACASLARWQGRLAGFMMAVNVSPRQFRAAGFIDLVGATMTEYGVQRGQLEIEVTEGLLLRNQAEVAQMLTTLDTMGVSLSMDDFGTGYSSLSYLREYPFDTIKIDRAFIRDVSSDPGDRAVVIAAVHMAKALGLKIIAEGVETDEQRDFLVAQRCDVLQGFRFGRPLPADAFEREWISGGAAVAA